MRAGPSCARLALVWPPRSPSPTRFRPVLSLCCGNFYYKITRTPRGPYIIFSSCFWFRAVSARAFLKFRSTMISNDDEGKKPLEDDLQDSEVEEEIEIE